MQDDFQPGFDLVERFDGAAPRPFPRVFVEPDEGDEETGRDALALAALLAGRADSVSDPARADLIVLGSSPIAVRGRTALDRGVRDALERSTCPVGVAPRGFAEREAPAPSRIDVGIDGSRGAAAAVEVALRLAIFFDARLRLVAVAELAFELGGEAREADPSELVRLSRRLAGAVGEVEGIRIERELLEGLPDQVLLGLARDTDLLVLGSRADYGNAGRVTLGAVAERVLRAAPCPTMIVPAV